jgi:hypothetical protein
VFVNIGDDIQMSSIPEMNEIPCNSEKFVMSVLSEIKVPKKCKFQKGRVPLELAVVLDVSGSMKPCIEEAKTAICNVLDGLLEQDIIHIVTYAEKAKIVVENGS